MQLLQAVRNQAARIASQIEDSNLFTHRGDRGEFREAIISDFLRPFLPECYGLNAGEVFSTDGAQSAQVDIVVYDAVFSIALFRDAAKMLFPAESIFGSIEVKSKLDSEQLAISIENVASVKRLSRAPSDMMDLLPSVRLTVGPSLAYNPAQKNPYLGFVFSYTGISPETVALELNRRLSANPTRKQELPDFLFVMHPGYMVARVLDQGSRQSLAVPGEEFTKFICISTGEDTLPLFYAALNVCLGALRLRTINFPALWEQLFGQVIQRANSGA